MVHLFTEITRTGKREVCDGREIIKRVIKQTILSYSKMEMSKRWWEIVKILIELNAER